MDIESKRYRIRSAGFGKIDVTTKSTGQTRQIDRESLPSVHEMAMMKEADWDRMIARL